MAFQRFMGEFSHNIRVQHIYGDGSLGFGLTGLDAADTEDGDFDYCGIAVNPETEEILVDFESEEVDGYHVKLQKFTYDGDYGFDNLGLSIARKSLDNNYSFGRVGIGSLPGGDWIVAYRDVQGYGTNTSFVIRRYDSEGNRVWTKTIGRNLDPTNSQIIVEDDGAYLFYRENASSKNPGVSIFRINIDGGYDFNKPEETAIATPGNSQTGKMDIFGVDGRRHEHAQKGINLVRQADGQVQKVLR